MGIKERHERDREAVKRAILDAARDLFVSEGYENVSIRKIAERIEYSPAAIYSYFPSKDEIFIALAEEGVRLFADCNTGPLDGLPAIERLRTHSPATRPVQHRAPAVLRTDVRRPDGPADLPRVRALRVCPGDAAGADRRAGTCGRRRRVPEDHSGGHGFSDSHHGRPGRRRHASLGPAHRGSRGRAGERCVECHVGRAQDGRRPGVLGLGVADRWGPSWNERRNITREIGSMRAFGTNRSRPSRHRRAHRARRH